jgi:hypothetical protein
MDARKARFARIHVKGMRHWAPSSACVKVKKAQQY